jgi:DNA modification methylase
LGRRSTVETTKRGTSCRIYLANHPFTLDRFRAGVRIQSRPLEHFSSRRNAPATLPNRMNQGRSTTIGPVAVAPRSVDVLHRFHPYCARFPSEIAEAAISELTGKGDSVCDPFCGSGTSLVAGLIQGRRVVGSDIDVLAGMLTMVKCAPREAGLYQGWRRRFVAELEDAFETIKRNWPPRSVPGPGTTWRVGELALSLPSFPELHYWFPPQVVALLAAVSNLAHKCQSSHYEQVALVSLSAAIVAKWPNSLSYAMDIDHTRPHWRIQYFRGDQALKGYLKRLDRTIECLNGLYVKYKEAGVLKKLGRLSEIYYPHDARKALPVPAESQALIVTSPPYFNAVDYPRAHRMSVCWMNGHAPVDLASRRNYIGLRHVIDFDSKDWLTSHANLRALVPAKLRCETLGTRLTAFFADLSDSLTEIWRLLRPGGHVVAVIGDNRVRGELVKSHLAFVRLAEETGFVEVERRRRAIDDVKRRFPVGPFGFDGPMTHEHLCVLRKPKPRSRSMKKS